MSSTETGMSDKSNRRLAGIHPDAIDENQDLS
jgi:hypothetical protein